MTNFALLQTNIAFNDPEANYAHVRELFAKAMQKTPRPDVVVLPEDWATGFSDVMFRGIGFRWGIPVKQNNPTPELSSCTEVMSFRKCLETIPACKFI